MAFTSCILFTSETSEQNTTSKGHLVLKKGQISREYDIHSFESQTSLTNFLMYVEHICLLFPGFNESYIALNICGLIWPLVVCSNYIVLKL